MMNDLKFIIIILLAITLLSAAQIIPMVSGLLLRPYFFVL